MGSKAVGEPPLLVAAAALMALQRAARAAREGAESMLAKGAKAGSSPSAPPAPFVPLLAPATVQAVREACGGWSAAELVRVSVGGGRGTGRGSGSAAGQRHVHLPVCHGSSGMLVGNHHLVNRPSVRSSGRVAPNLLANAGGWRVSRQRVCGGVIRTAAWRARSRHVRNPPGLPPFPRARTTASP